MEKEDPITAEAYRGARENLTLNQVQGIVCYLWLDISQFRL
jgi:tRNA G37 N-methylase Trm5